MTNGNLGIRFMKFNINNGKYIESVGECSLDEFSSLINKKNDFVK